MIEFTLPFPPSMNRMWRNIAIGGRPRTLLSAEGRSYRLDCLEAVLDQRVPRERLHGSLAVSIKVFAPDKRKRDLDNLCKGILDALKHCKIIEDDSCIDRLEVSRGPKSERGGEVWVQVVRYAA